MEKEWNIKLNGEGLSAKEIIFNIMSSRGVNNIDSFLHPTAENLLPLTSLSNIDRAKDIILNTIKNEKSFLIYADVDLDGCSSAAIAYRYLKNYTDKISTYINVNKEHGVQEEFLATEDFNTCDVVIVVDSINDSPECYDRILSAGKELIIIDHHVPSGAVLSKNYCLISSSVNYKNPHLSGSGVTWKVMKYIDSATGNNYANLLVDLAASGIIGDVCNVGLESPENRYICYLGLNNLNNIALKQVVGNYDFTSTTVSYSIAPLINAANRTGHNREALDFFLTDDRLTMLELYDKLVSYKEYQKSEISRLYEEIIIPQAQNQLDNKCMYFLNNGVSTFNGVVAGKAAEDFGRPVMVLSKSSDGKLFSGSMRAVGVENFRGIVDSCAYASCMGHESSAGVDIDVNNFFVVYNYVEERLKDYQFVRKIDVDARLLPRQITESLIVRLKSINKISGQGFKPIQICVDNITDYKVSTMSNGKHLSVKLGDGFTIIKWNMTEKDKVLDGGKFSAVGTLDINEFRGRVTRQLILTDYIYTSEVKK